MPARVSFRRPVTLNSLFASMQNERAWLGRPNGVSPRARETLSTPRGKYAYFSKARIIE